MKMACLLAALSISLSLNASTTNLVDGCYYCDGEYVGIDTNATRIVFPVECSGVSLNGCGRLEEVVMPKKFSAVMEPYHGCWKLERVVFRGGPDAYLDSMPQALISIIMRMSSMMSLVLMADAIYYPESESSKWKKVLRNVGYGGICSSYAGEWTGLPVKPAAGARGFVAVIAEVRAQTAVAVPASWTNDMPNFASSFGADLAQAVMKKTGKIDAAGDEMRVWHDYVAGTDPTDIKDLFSAAIHFDEDKKPVIEYSPKRDDRKYTIYGKGRLQDDDWNVVSGDAERYNFFKVTVEMP